VFRGYWRQSRESQAMLRDGWLHTADIGFMDNDGFVTIIDRKRDVIMASGFSVFPSEVEDVILEHPAVDSCAVVGVSHYYRGETVKAYVVLKAGGYADEPELQRFCAARLAAYKVPASFDFRDSLPQNMLGKVLRRVLRDEYEALRARTNYDESPAPLPRPAPGTAAAPASPRPASAAVDIGLVDELERLVRLHADGQLTDDEFAAAKARLLG
jgi:long-chain acyl-CoA synthetase